MLRFSKAFSSNFFYGRFSLFFGKKQPFSNGKDPEVLDMESKNTHLRVNLINPFQDEENDTKQTEWRRYWNINDSPDVQYYKKHRRYYVGVILTATFLLLVRYHGNEEHFHFYPIH